MDMASMTQQAWKQGGIKPDQILANPTEDMGYTISMAVPHVCQ